MEYQRIKKAIIAKGYKWYDDVLMMNNIFVRMDYDDTNTFKDKAYICYISEIGKEVVIEADVTTLPGWYWLLNPMNKDGCAIVKPGQYTDADIIGKHYEQNALVQRGNLVVYRDNTKDKKIDLDNTYMTKDSAINIHHADGIAKSVGKWSAGCFVFQSTEKHNDFMFVCNRQVEYTKNKKFTRTLIMQQDLT
jgi:hypothetical protein